MTVINPVIPDQQSIGLFAGNDYQGKFVPKNPDGTVVDLSGVAAMNIHFTSGQSGLQTCTARDVAATIVLADASGVTFQIANSDIQNIFSYTHQQFGTYSATCTPTTPAQQVTVAQGQWNLNSVLGQLG